MGLLGAMLIDPACIGQVLQIIPREGADRFYLPQHRALYATLLDLYDQNRQIDVVLLRDELHTRGLLETVGGVDYLVQLSESVPSSANCEYYANLVRGKGMLRDLILAAGEIVDHAYFQRIPAEEVLDQAEKRLFAVTEQRVRRQAVLLREVLTETFRVLEAREGHVLTGLATGLTELDDLTSGLQPGELIIVAGRPSMGKTALGLCLAENMAAEKNIPVAFFSMEMSRQQIAQRVLASRGGVDAHAMRRGMLSADKIAHLAIICGELCEKPIFVDDTPGMGVMELRAKARRLQMQHQIRCVFVDYLQLMHDHRASRDSRQHEIATISRGLKALARELEIPVIAMAQLNRNPEERTGNRPRMSDLRESGAIEQDADVVMLLHREEYYKPDDPDLKGKAELIVAKQRNGPTGVIELQFEEKIMRFRDLNLAAHSGYDRAAPLRVYEPPPADAEPLEETDPPF